MGQISNKIKSKTCEHKFPFSKGGTSLTADNVRILCMKCNLNKSNKILTIPPVLFS